MNKLKEKTRHTEPYKLIYTVLTSYLLHVKMITHLLSRGEICVANFIPPVNGASLGSFFVENLG